MTICCQEEPLFTALIQKRFRKELNTALTDAQKEALGKDEIAQKKPMI